MLNSIQMIIYTAFKNLQDEILKKENIKAFIFVFSIYIVAYLSIFRSGVDYLDDIERGYTGKRGWQNFSRYTSNFLSSIFNMSNKLTDMSPITQLIAVALLSIASIILAKIFIKKTSHIALAIATLIGINPFFLECISFKFDAPYMALAVLMAIFPFAFIENRVKFILVSIPAILVLYTTYQPENSIFIILSIFYILKMFFDGRDFKEILKTFTTILIGFGISTIIFKFLIVTEINTYVSSKALNVDNFIPGIKANLSQYFSLINEHFKGTIIYKLTILLFILFPITIYWETKSIFKVLLTIFLVFLAAVSSYGLYTLLEKPLFEARALNGGGALMAISLLFILSYSTKFLEYLWAIIGTIFIWNCIVISNTYGNALIAQKEYNDYRLMAMINTLNTNVDSFEGLQLYIANPQKRTAKELEHAAKVFPIINDLIRDRLQRQYWWSAVHNILLKINVKPKIQKCVSDFQKPDKTIETVLHRIELYKANNCIIVYFN